MSKFEKLERDGKVAILYSPGYGAGWSTWAHGHEEELLFDKELVELVLAGKRKEVAILAKKKYPGAYTGGADQLKVEWIEKGDRFEIHEYDGSESVRLFGKDDGYVA